MHGGDGSCFVSQLQLPGCRGQADQVHIAPHLNGDRRLATLDDCVSVCRHCHARVPKPLGAVR